MRDNAVKSYDFDLGPGHTWSFSAAPDAANWLRRLAGIFRLKANTRTKPRKMFFSRKAWVCNGSLVQSAPGPAPFAKNLPCSGWDEKNLKTLRFFTHKKSPATLVSLGIPITRDLDIIRMWQALYPVYERILALGGMPVHAALVEREGKAMILAAPGGTGKSTCARRIPRPWRALADDEVMLVKHTRRFEAHPFPTWSEYLHKRSKKTWDISKKTRLCAVFFLRQAARDRAEPLGPGQAAAFLTLSAAQVMNRIWMRFDDREKRKMRETIFTNACRIASSIPSFVLHVSRKGRFWEEIENVLR